MLSWGEITQGEPEGSASMCGMTGIIDWESDLSQSAFILKRMTATLSHRGQMHRTLGFPRAPRSGTHIHLNGSYHFTDLALHDDFRPLLEYHGSRAYLSEPPESQETEAALSREEETTPLPTQLTLLTEDEQD